MTKSPHPRGKVQPASGSGLGIVGCGGGTGMSACEGRLFNPPCATAKSEASVAATTGSPTSGTSDRSPPLQGQVPSMSAGAFLAVAIGGLYGLFVEVDDGGGSAARKAKPKALPEADLAD